MNKEIEFGVCCTTEYEQILLKEIDNYQKKIEKINKIFNELKFKVEDEGSSFNELYELELILNGDNNEIIDEENDEFEDIELLGSISLDDYRMLNTNELHKLKVEERITIDKLIKNQKKIIERLNKDE